MGALHSAGSLFCTLFEGRIIKTEQEDGKMSKNGSAGNDRKRIYIKSFYRKNRICFLLTILTTLCLNGMQILLAVLLKGLMDAATNENMDGLWKLTGQTIIYEIGRAHV